MATTVNHELGHLLGLDHPFQGRSTCADAPAHPNAQPNANPPVYPNCWNLNSPPGPDCDAWSKVSNNLMDYNAAQSSLSPCQIGIIQNNLNTCLRDRFVYKCSDCLPGTAMFEIPVITECMPAPIWLDGRVAFNYNWYKVEIDEVTASGALVAGTHYESQTYSNVIGRIRLDAVYSFVGNRPYRVKLSTHPSCAAVATAVQVRTFTTPPCAKIPVGQPGTPQATSTTTSFSRK